ncbi:AMP-binding protein [Pseudoleptotrichia goodfellowii]|uniref:AMP-binding protein n=1 Tax=Pseudoleptotrichia goodfellowii TaxID=157692 RepID=UPI001F4130C6|nr:AMP-binding protein [Pseudoleptotrichia goodfellowii]
MKAKNVKVYFQTSGTSQTKFFKIVPHTEGEIIDNASFNAEFLKIEKNDVGGMVLPLVFGYANISQLVMHLLMKNTIVLMKNTDHPRKILNKIERYRVTHMAFTPFYLELINMCNNLKINFNSLRKICFRGSVLTLENYLESKKIFPKTEFIQTYGQIEAGPRITGKKIEKEYNPKNVGKAIKKTKIKILKKEKLSNKIGEIGEIVVKIPCIIKKYFKIRRNILFEKKWLKTGDVGYFNEKKDLILLGRKNNIIKNRGF